jgi:hypothetical protein
MLDKHTLVLLLVVSGIGFVITFLVAEMLHRKEMIRARKPLASNDDPATNK